MIESERLLLRPFQEADAADLYEYLKNPSVNCFKSMKITDLEHAKKEVKNRMNDKKYYFAIVLKNTNKVIGEIAAHPENHSPDETIDHYDTFSPIWMLNKDYQGFGYAYEATKHYFSYLFTEIGARRIYAYTEDDNLASQRLCEKLGMRKEGFFLEFVSFINNPDGTPHYENTIQYALLKKEWNK